MDRLGFLFKIGGIFSPLYGLAMVLRSRLYAAGFLRHYRLDVPVISVGNLTWGGTGKTPAVIALAKFAVEMGLRPLIISRGYGGASREKVNVVSDETKVLMNASQAGDEPVFIAESLPGTAVLTGAKRVLPGRYAVHRFRPDFILLDDGFQHLALDRQLDIVLLNSSAPFGNGRVFPGGQLREPLGALERADCFVASGSSRQQGSEYKSLAERLHGFVGDKPLFASFFRLQAVSLHGGGASEPIGQQAGRRVFAFCGLANPDSFRSSLQEAAVEVVGLQVFADHHPYRQEDVRAIEKAFAASGADLLLTTEKDYVKVRTLLWRAPLAVVRGETVFDEAFYGFLATNLHRLVAGCRQNI